MPKQLDIAVDSVTLRLRVWPAVDTARRPAVLLPATGETAEDWDIVASFLHSSRTVHAVSLRGHGPSDWPGHYSIQAMADDATGLIRQLDDRPVDLVGHSLGGLVACRVASTNPELVHRLVLEDVGVLHPRPAMAPPRPPGVLSFDWRMVEQVRPEIDDPDPRWSDVVTGISAPTLVIAGGPSSPVPQEHIAELVRLLPADSWSPWTPATSCTPGGRKNSPTTCTRSSTASRLARRTLTASRGMGAGLSARAPGERDLSH